MSHPARRLPLHTAGPLLLPLAAALIGSALLLGAPPEAIASPAAASAAAGSTDPAFELAFQAFQRAAAGDASAVGPAVQAFEALVRAQPGDPVRLAYAGAATAMQAGQAWLPWRKMQYAEDGLAQLDKALSLLAPAHDAPGPRGVAPALEVRFTAASTFLALPSLFKRHARGEKLLAETLSHPGFEAAPLSFKGAVWLRAGQAAAAADRPADARRWLQRVVSSQAPQAAAAQAQLKALGA